MVEIVPNLWMDALNFVSVIFFFQLYPSLSIHTKSIAYNLLISVSVVLNFLGLWRRDLMILLGLKMWTEFLFWAYNLFFELNFLGFFVCLFLKKIYGDEPKEYEHVLQKKIMKEIKFFNLIILFYFKRILKKWKKLLCQQCTSFATSAFSVN